MHVTLGSLVSLGRVRVEEKCNFDMLSSIFDRPMDSMRGEEVCMYIDYI